MFKEIAVDTNILSNDLEGLQNELKMIRQDIQNMYEAVRTLDNMWTGPAKDTFVSQFLKDEEDMTTLCDAIQGMIDCMSNAKSQYNNCESEVSRIVASIRI